jgi:hypothetical protein
MGEYRSQPSNESLELISTFLDEMFSRPDPSLITIMLALESAIYAVCLRASQGDPDLMRCMVHRHADVMRGNLEGFMTEFETYHTESAGHA